MCNADNTCVLKPRTAPVPTPTAFLVDAMGNVNNDVAIGLGVTFVFLLLICVLVGQWPTANHAKRTAHVCAVATHQGILYYVFRIRRRAQETKTAAVLLKRSASSGALTPPPPTMY